MQYMKFTDSQYHAAIISLLKRLDFSANTEGSILSGNKNKQILLDRAGIKSKLNPVTEQLEVHLGEQPPLTFDTVTVGSVIEAQRCHFLGLNAIQDRSFIDNAIFINKLLETYILPEHKASVVNSGFSCLELGSGNGRLVALLSSIKSDYAKKLILSEPDTLLCEELTKNYKNEYFIVNESAENVLTKGIPAGPGRVDKCLDQCPVVLSLNMIDLYPYKSHDILTKIHDYLPDNGQFIGLQEYYTNPRVIEHILNSYPDGIPYMYPAQVNELRMLNLSGHSDTKYHEVIALLEVHHGLSTSSKCEMTVAKDTRLASYREKFRNSYGSIMSRIAKMPTQISRQIDVSLDGLAYERINLMDYYLTYLKRATIRGILSLDRLAKLDGLTVNTRRDRHLKLFKVHKCDMAHASSNFGFIQDTMGIKMLPGPAVQPTITKGLWVLNKVLMTRVQWLAHLLKPYVSRYMQLKRVKTQPRVIHSKTPKQPKFIQRGVQEDLRTVYAARSPKR